MQNEARQTLIELIQTRGPELIDDPRRLEGLLRDHCGQYRAEITAVVGAAREGVPRDLMDQYVSVPPEMRLARLARRLEDNLALSPEAARWATESWAMALGVTAGPGPIVSGDAAYSGQTETSFGAPAASGPRSGGPAPAPNYVAAGQAPAVNYAPAPPMPTGSGGQAPAVKYAAVSPSGAQVRTDLASRGTRFGAVAIDTVIYLVPYFMLISGSSGLAVVGLLGLLGVIGYQFYLLTTKGQSIGKQLVGIRIVKIGTRENGGFVTNVLLRSIVSALCGLSGIYPVVDALFIFRADQRCLHDLIASTEVIVADKPAP